MKLICAHADTCLSDYWGGHHLPHVAVPVNRDTTFADLRSMIIDELRAGVVAGADATPETTYENDEWYAAAYVAVERDVQPPGRGVEYPFHDLDVSDDEDVESVYAYFVFVPEPENVPQRHQLEVDMNRYYIESQAGVIMGIYEGASAEDAVAALNADAGGSDSVAADWIIREVIEVDQDWEHEATLYTLSDGGVLVESGPHRDYYPDIRSARAALSGTEPEGDE